MTNDNNNINSLVSYPDDDPTLDREIPSVLADGLEVSDLDPAADATAVVNSESNPDSEIDGQSITVLRSNLISTAQQIQRLEVDGNAASWPMHESEVERSRKLIAEQSGQLSGYADDLRHLTARISAAERYADDLRQKLQDQSEISGAALKSEQDLQAALAAARIKIGALSESLEIAERRKAELTDTLGADRKKFAEESRQLRGNLDSALEAIADQTSTNEQLLSDLFDNKGFRQALEVQLSETEARNDKRVRHLEKKANRLRNQADDYERKLKNKDNAIAAMMNELANRSSKMESIDKIENVIRQIDNRNAKRINNQGTANPERVTRLLIGNAGGQVLRFPLFKNRLTIGRTPHNDIQLDAQFISRRHAVIVTEKKGTRIVDWGSRNGVFINDKRVSEQLLKNGDVVTIGTTDFRYEERPKR